MTDTFCELLPCPFCSGPAEKKITDGPNRGFIGCFKCNIGTPFNVPYGDHEVEAWNTRTNIENARLREVLAEAIIPYAALLVDAESRKWIAPNIWKAIETAVKGARAALERK